MPTFGRMFSLVCSSGCFINVLDHALHFISRLAHLPSGSVSHFFRITSSSCHPLSVFSPPSLPPLPPPCVCSEQDSCIKASATPLEYQLQHSLRTVGGILCVEEFPCEETLDRTDCCWTDGEQWQSSGSTLHMPLLYTYANMDTNFDSSMMKRDFLPLYLWLLL